MWCGCFWFPGTLVACNQRQWTRFGPLVRSHQPPAQEIFSDRVKNVDARQAIARSRVVDPQPELLAGAEIMLLEDDVSLRRRLAAHLGKLGAEITPLGTIAEARRAIDGIRFDFALLDLHLPDGEALELLREGRFSENTGVVVMTAFGAVKDAVDAMRHGAGDYLSKPFEPDELPLAFLRCRERRGMVRRDEHRTGLGAPAAAHEFFFGSSLGVLRERLETIIAADRRLSRFLPPVLVEGEAGAGKTTLAAWLHLQGPRAAQPFIKLDCSALPEETGEAELFGLAWPRGRRQKG